MDRQQQEKLLDILEKLSSTDQAAVASFAEFLLSRSSTDKAVIETVSSFPAEVPDPESIPRPQEEKVVSAVKRLSKTYFMLDKKKMLGVTSDLMTQHLIHGRDALEVIDELERVFEKHYRQLKQVDNS